MCGPTQRLDQLNLSTEMKPPLRSMPPDDLNPAKPHEPILPLVDPSSGHRRLEIPFSPLVIAFSVVAETIVCFTMAIAGVMAFGTRIGFFAPVSKWIAAVIAVHIGMAGYIWLVAASIAEYA